MATVDDVNGIIGELRDGWWTVLDLQAYREAWLQLDPSLGRYPGSRGVLREIYEHAMLAGCRRLVDRTKGMTSVWRALDRLHRIAPQVTAEVLVETRRGDALDPWEGTRLDVARENLARVNGREDRDGRLLKQPVLTDRRDLETLHGHVVQLANEITAHASDSEPTVTVTDDDIERMLAHVLDVVQRWVALLEGVGLSSSPPRRGDTKAMVKALELFDWREYVIARMERVREFGPAITATQERWVDDNVAVQFTWPDHPPPPAR